MRFTDNDGPIPRSRPGHRAMIRPARKSYRGLGLLMAFAVTLAAVVAGGVVISGSADARSSEQPTGTEHIAAITLTDGAYYELASRSSGKVVDVAGRSMLAGGRVIQWSRNGGPNQQFRFEASGEGYYRLRARHSGKVLDIKDGSRSDAVIQQTDHQVASQQWRPQLNAGYVTLINRKSGKALDVAAWSTADGGQIVQYTSKNTANQQWTLTKVGGGVVSPTPVPATPAPVPTRPGSSPTATPSTTGPTTPPAVSASATTGPTVTSPPPTRPAPPVSSPPATGKTQCGDYANVTQGKYWINNNTWGKNSGSGTQCIWNSYTNADTIGWGTNWNWTGKSNSVKTFASAILGWHWGTRIANTGLPVQLSAGHQIRTHWAYDLTENGPSTLDVSYDLWLHKISKPTYADTPTDEVMVWLHRSGGAGPVGTKQATVTVDGTAWDLYRGNIGWNVYSFVRQANSDDSTLDLSDFLGVLSSRGWMEQSKYLTSVEAGTEVFIGKGRLDTTAYSVNVE